MKIENISLSGSINIDPSSSINNVSLGNSVKIAKRCSIYGSPENIVLIGDSSYIGMNTVINGFNAKITIGQNVSVAQNVNVMADSGPNASPALQKLYPIVKGDVSIGDHCWIGASAIIMPGVKLGKYCIVAANSYVSDSFDDYSVIGGIPAKLIKKIDPTTLE
ncbi:transferase [Pectobacterium odoriferum]|uniref:Transferase n=2 Tax=Pectobacterium odoriferum TaxID=78398 RepID=A0ABR4VU44_9GAMM|nr:transferase [Pectobacterium odoriferum]